MEYIEHTSSFSQLDSRKSELETFPPFFIYCLQQKIEKAQQKHFFQFFCTQSFLIKN